MRQKRFKGWQALAAVALLCCSGCLGPNHAVGRLSQWNANIDGKWGNEAAFVGLLPVYALFSVGDVLIFNSMQWWTGDNPIGAPERSGAVL